MPGNSHRKMERKLRTVILVILVISIGTAIGLVFTPLFHVQEAWCEGNNRVSQEEILSVAQVELGKNIFAQSLSGIRKRVEQVSMVEEAKVRRIFPNKIKIWVRECVPTGYIHTDDKLVLIDMNGKVLEIVDDGRVKDMLMVYTPQKIESYEAKKEKPDDEKEDSASPEDKEEKTEKTEKKEENKEENKEEQTEPANEEEQEITPQDISLDWAHQVPLVVGIELEKTDVSKKIDSKERDKLKKLMESFECLEKAGLLRRATYLDITDINDIVLVIENRLEILLGDLENMEYRCMFLAKVINEKISSTESVIMDYRTEDIYVRQPEDGKERMVHEETEEESETDEESEKSEEKEPAKLDKETEKTQENKPAPPPKPMSDL